MNDEERERIGAVVREVLLEENYTKVVRRGSRGSVMGGSILPKPTFGTPSNIGVANAEGASIYLNRLDHVHNHPAALGFDLHHDHYAKLLPSIYGLWFPDEQATTAQRLHLVPFQAEYTLTVDLIGFLGRDPVQGQCKVGIYADNGGVPDGGALLVGSAASGAMAGNNQRHEIDITNTQIFGLCWLAYLALAGVQPTICHINWQTRAGGIVEGVVADIASDNLPANCPATGADEIPSLYVIVASVP